MLSEIQPFEANADETLHEGQTSNDKNAHSKPMTHVSYDTLCPASCSSLFTLFNFSIIQKVFFKHCNWEQLKMGY